MSLVALKVLYRERILILDMDTNKRTFQDKNIIHFLLFFLLWSDGKFDCILSMKENEHKCRWPICIPSAHAQATQSQLRAHVSIDTCTCTKEKEKKYGEGFKQSTKKCQPIRDSQTMSPSREREKSPNKRISGIN